MEEPGCPQQPGCSVDLDPDGNQVVEGGGNLGVWRELGVRGTRVFEGTSAFRGTRRPYHFGENQSVRVEPVQQLGNQGEQRGKENKENYSNNGTRPVGGTRVSSVAGGESGQQWNQCSRKTRAAGGTLMTTEHGTSVSRAIRRGQTTLLSLEGAGAHPLPGSAFPAKSNTKNAT